MFPATLTMKFPFYSKANEQIYRENFGKHQITHTYECFLQAKLNYFEVIALLNVFLRDGQCDHRTDRRGVTGTSAYYCTAGGKLLQTSACWTECCTD